MYNIIPLVLIFLSLAVIIVIITRKFSVLANLNIEAIQAEKEARLKEQIISNRIKRNFFRYYNYFIRFLGPLLKSSLFLLKKFYSGLLEIKESHKNVDKSDSVDKNFSVAEDLIKQGKFDEAEKKYIEIIKNDPSNLDAFLRLGRFYYERKNYNEAKQSFEHVLRLLEKNIDIYNSKEKDNVNSQIAGVYFNIANIYKEENNINEALLSINRALSLEESNPRYLDTKLEISIINKDLNEAQRTYEKLKEVNPKNQKLLDFKKRIEKIKEKMPT